MILQSKSIHTIVDTVHGLAIRLQALLLHVEIYDSFHVGAIPVRRVEFPADAICSSFLAQSNKQRRREDLHVVLVVNVKVEHRVVQGDGGLSGASGDSTFC
jgi:hypothetical protein